VRETKMVHVYTGNGKGKTTAAIGSAIRAVGAGFRVLIVQFIKNGDYSEIKALNKFSDSITIKQFGLGHFIKGMPSAEDFNAAQIGIEETETMTRSGNYGMVILDEANVAVKLGLFSVEDLLYIIDNKPDNVELIITGRGAEQKLIEKADLVTEMKEIKHYFRNGVMARVGIEK
jgi:cob(I)alamin adenosyltransferase